MKATNDLVIRVIDSGLFLPVAQRFARDAKRVEYWTPDWEIMPVASKSSVGDGFPDIERIDCPFENADDVDFWCFPDINFGKMQEYLLSQGKIVWGSRRADELENNRGLFLRMLKRVGLEVPKHVAIRGMSKLISHLRQTENVWIKISKYRGDWETMHWRSWDEDKTELYLRAGRLGPIGELIVFYVFDPIDTMIEDGSDWFCIDGKFPKTGMHGMENKDKGYLCSVAKFSDLPEAVRGVNEAFSEVLAEYGYRGDFSAEVRIVEDGGAFFIDPTCRKGSPPSQVQTEMFSNYTEYHWAGANGEIVEPEPLAEFGAQVMLHASGSPGTWIEFELPEDLAQWIKVGQAVRIGSRICIAPGDASRDAGWLCATGDTIEETISTLRERIAALPDGLSADVNSIADILSEVHEAEKKGMEFTNQTVPEPEIVLSGNGSDE